MWLRSVERGFQDLWGRAHGGARISTALVNRFCRHSRAVGAPVCAVRAVGRGARAAGAGLRNAAGLGAGWMPVSRRRSGGVV